LFFTGSAAEVTPIRKVDNVTIGDGGRGPVTEEIQSAFFELVERKTDAHDDWFTYV
ncbi:MAG: branched-chain amino acid transaminase, partial [Halonotius sp.]